MGRGKCLTPEEKDKIIAYKERNLSYRQIAKKVGKSRNAICNFFKNTPNHGNNIKERTKKAISSTAKKQILREATNSHCSSSNIHSNLELKENADIVPEVIYKGLADRRLLKRGAIPTVNSLANNTKEEDEVKAMESVFLKETNEAFKSEPHFEIAEMSTDSLPNFPVIKNEPHSLEDSEEKFIPANESYFQLENERLEEQIKHLNAENSYLRNTKNAVLKKLVNAKRKNLIRLKAAEVKLSLRKRKFFSQINLLERRLKTIEDENYNMETKLESILTHNQIVKIKRGVKIRKTWTIDDIAHSIMLYNASVNAYKFLHAKGFPLPEIRTLHKWCEKFEVLGRMLNPTLRKE